MAGSDRPMSAAIRVQERNLAEWEADELAVPRDGRVGSPVVQPADYRQSRRRTMPRRARGAP